MSLGRRSCTRTGPLTLSHTPAHASRWIRKLPSTSHTRPSSPWLVCVCTWAASGRAAWLSQSPCRKKTLPCSPCTAARFSSASTCSSSCSPRPTSTCCSRATFSSWAVRRSPPPWALWCSGTRAVRVSTASTGSCRWWARSTFAGASLTSSPSSCPRACAAPTLPPSTGC